MGTLHMVETSQEDSRMDRSADNLGSEEEDDDLVESSSSSRPQLLSSSSADKNRGRSSRRDGCVADADADADADDHFGELMIL